jgi:hypothetical protein
VSDTAARVEGLANSSNETGRVGNDDTAARIDAEPDELCELFFAADGAERRLILLHLDYAAIEPAEPDVALQQADIRRLETAALRHETETVMRELQRVLGVSGALAYRIVTDESGEPIVAAGKAMNLPTEIMQRIVLFLNPLVGQSVDRVYQLAGLYGEISVEAARRLVALWRLADPTWLRPTLHEPLPWRRAAENARRALSEISHAPPQARRDIAQAR